MPSGIRCSCHFGIRLHCSGICFPVLMSRIEVCGRALGYRCSNTSATVRQVLTKAHSLMGAPSAIPLKCSSKQLYLCGRPAGFRRASSSFPFCHRWRCVRRSCALGRLQMSSQRTYIGQIVVPSPTLRTWQRHPKFGPLKCLQALAARESQCSRLVMGR